MKSSLLLLSLVFISNSYACYKVKDNSSDGYACGKVDSSGDVFVKKSDNSDDGYKWVYSGKSDKGNSSTTTTHHYYHNDYGNHYGSGYGYNNYDSHYYGSGSTYTGGSVSTTCSPDMMESNVVKTDKVAKNFLKDEKFASQEAFIAILKNIQNLKNDEAKLKAYFSLVNVQNAADIAFFVGARDDEFDRYEANLVANTELDPALAKIVVAKMIKSLRGNQFNIN